MSGFRGEYGDLTVTDHGEGCEERQESTRAEVSPWVQQECTSPPMSYEEPFKDHSSMWHDHHMTQRLSRGRQMTNACFGADRLTD